MQGLVAPMDKIVPYGLYNPIEKWLNSQVLLQLTIIYYIDKLQMEI